MESPYAYVKSPNAGKEGKGKGKEREREPWHWHTKQRHMMKAEMDDAFRVRKWVVVFLFACGGAVLFGGWAAVRWVGYFWRSWGEGGRVVFREI